MKAKGQLSFDVYFAIIFALILVSQVSTVSDQFRSSSNEIGISTQEQQIGNSLAAIINSTQALSEGKAFTVDYTIPKIIDSEKLNAQSCDIDIDAFEIKIYYPGKASAEKIQATVPFNDIAGASIPTTANCGDKITIAK